MPTNQQRREAERRRLQRQLDDRREREGARKRFTLVASIVGTIVVIVAIFAVVIVANHDDKKKSNDAAGSPGSCAAPSKGATASFNGVTVGKATDLKSEPKVSSKATKAPAALQCQDLVVGKGKAATASSSVTVQYTGVLYANGKKFDSSWARGQAATFSLAQVVPGFTQGIGGNAKVDPMKVGGRRIIILPPALGYGAQANGPIPANSPLVFVVDLVKVA